MSRRAEQRRRNRTRRRPLEGAHPVRHLLHELYFGDTRRGIRFRLWVLTIDFLIIGFFIVAPIIRESRFFLAVDLTVAVILAAELCARAVAWGDLRSWLRRPIVWVDLFVLATLLAPMWLINLSFLRILRLWSLVNSDMFWKTVAARYEHSRWEDPVRAGATLLTFIFVVTGFVYTSFAHQHPGIKGYLDALYFTIATLTTTGFGDITLPGTWGRLLSIVTMIAGITLFVRLAQALIRPYKVAFRCPSCGLLRHDHDAVHCKACGQLLDIPNDEW